MGTWRKTCPAESGSSLRQADIFLGSQGFLAPLKYRLVWGHMVLSPSLIPHHREWRVNFLLALVKTQNSKIPSLIYCLLHTMLNRPQQLTREAISTVQYTGDRGRSQVVEDLEIEDMTWLAFLWVLIPLCWDSYSKVRWRDPQGFLSEYYWDMICLLYCPPLISVRGACYRLCDGNVTADWHRRKLGPNCHLKSCEVM